MVVLVGKLPDVWGLKQLVANRPDSSLRWNWLLVLIVVLLGLHDLRIISRV